MRRDLVVLMFVGREKGIADSDTEPSLYHDRERCWRDAEEMHEAWC